MIKSYKARHRAKPDAEPTPAPAPAGEPRDLIVEVVDRSAYDAPAAWDYSSASR
jgi:hypothetical protein